MDLIMRVVAAGMPSPWVCTVCGTGLAKIAADVKQNTARIGNAETKIESMDGEVTSLREANSQMKKDMKVLEDKVDKMSEDASNK